MGPGISGPARPLGVRKLLGRVFGSLKLGPERQLPSSIILTPRSCRLSKSWGAAWAEVSASDRKPGAPAASNDAREKRELVRPRCEAVAELEWPDWKEATSPCSQGHSQHRSRLIPGTGPDTSVWRNGAGMEGIRIMRD